MATFDIWNKSSGVVVLTHEHEDSQLYTVELKRVNLAIFLHCLFILPNMHKGNCLRQLKDQIKRASGLPWCGQSRIELAQMQQMMVLPLVALAQTPLSPKYRLEVSVPQHKRASSGLEDALLWCILRPAPTQKKEFLRFLYIYALNPVQVLPFATSLFFLSFFFASPEKARDRNQITRDTIPSFFVTY